MDCFGSLGWIIRVRIVVSGKANVLTQLQILGSGFFVECFLVEGLGENIPIANQKRIDETDLYKIPSFARTSWRFSLRVQRALWQWNENSKWWKFSKVWFVVLFPYHCLGTLWSFDLYDDFVHDNERRLRTQWCLVASSVISQSITLSQSTKWCTRFVSATVSQALSVTLLQQSVGFCIDTSKQEMH